MKLRRRLPTLAPVSLMLGILIGAFAVWLWQGTLPWTAEGRALETFRAAYQLTHDRYVDASRTAPQDLVYDAIAGMIEGLGDTGHSRFLTPQQRRQEQQSLSGSFVGIGVEMAERDGRPVVASVYQGSPAARAGLRPGDRILKVNGEDVSNLGLGPLGERLRGPEGSEVRLTVLHPDNQAQDVTLRREQIDLPFVTWASIGDSGIWHIRISRFGQNTAAELDRALQAARQGGATGIVLDLRDNPGGLLDEAIGVASRFVEDGTVLIERDRAGKEVPITVKEGVDAAALPVTLLINNGTASAAEVVSSALLYHDRATAVGVSTFGTATVLRTFPLPDGSALLLGVEEWLTPAGEPLRNRGVTPTERVDLPPAVQPLMPPTPASPPEQVCPSADAQLRAAAATLGLPCRT